MAVSASKVDLAPSPSGARSPPSPPPCRRICQLHAPTGVRYGTVRYAGPVEGTRGEWLGVEWDLDGRGKHDGLHAGRRYFECSRPGSDVASFIRPDGVGVGRGVSLIAALNEKYVGSTSAADATSLPSSSSAPAYSRRNLAEIEIEMPNMDKVSARVRVLANLKTVALVGPVERMASADRGEDGEVQGPSRAELADEVEWIVGRVGDGDCDGDGDEEISRRIAETIPNVTYLDLSRTLLTSWSSIAVAIHGLTQLDSLHLHYNRFESPSPRDLAQIRTSQGLASLRELGLDRSRIAWSDVAVILEALPALNVIHLANNHIGELVAPLQHHTALREVNLQNNRIGSWSQVVDTLGGLPALERLHLSGNLISEIGGDDGDDHDDGMPPRFPALTHLGINDNPLWSREDHQQMFRSLSHLERSCPSLTSLNATCDALKQTWTMEVIARMSRLTRLNGTTVAPAQRRDAELWWVSHMEGVLEEKVRRAVAEVEAEKQETNAAEDVARRVLLQFESDEPRWRKLKARYGDGDDNGTEALLKKLTAPKTQNNLKSKFIHVELVHGAAPPTAKASSVTTQSIPQFPLLPQWSVKIARGRILRALGIKAANSKTAAGMRWFGVLHGGGGGDTSDNAAGLVFELDDPLKSFDACGFAQGDELWVVGGEGGDA